MDAARDRESSQPASAMGGDEFTSPLQWQEDILGPDYQSLSLLVPARPKSTSTITRKGTAATLKQRTPDTSYRATLVRHRPLNGGAYEATRAAGEYQLPANHGGRAVLFLHGWSDYFFNTALAEFFTSRGYSFYALDLHNHGRSLNSLKWGGYVADLADYDAEILAAHATIESDMGSAKATGGHNAPATAPSHTLTAPRPLILVGHSTGGLTATLWAHHHPERVSHLILNSPWLELQGGAALRRAASPLVQCADLRPLMRMRVPERPFYWRGISAEAYGEWQVDRKLRPPQAFPVRAGWMKAILAAQQEVASGLQLPVPVLVLLSSKSLLGPLWKDQMLQADVVLDVRSLALRSLSLGNSVTLERIDGALHEVFLSREPVRSDAYDRLARWLRGYVA